MPGGEPVGGHHHADAQSADERLLEAVVADLQAVGVLQRHHEQGGEQHQGPGGPVRGGQAGRGPQGGADDRGGQGEAQCLAYRQRSGDQRFAAFVAQGVVRAVVGDVAAVAVAGDVVERDHRHDHEDRAEQEQARGRELPGGEPTGGQQERRQGHGNGRVVVVDVELAQPGVGAEPALGGRDGGGRDVIEV